MISATSTQKYLIKPDLSQICEGVWNLQVSKIVAYASAKIQVMTS